MGISPPVRRRRLALDVSGLTKGAREPEGTGPIFASCALTMPAPMRLPRNDLLDSLVLSDSETADPTFPATSEEAGYSAGLSSRQYRQDLGPYSKVTVRSPFFPNRGPLRHDSTGVSVRTRPLESLVQYLGYWDPKT